METVYPKISIITPVYNCAQFLDRCIRSVLNQDFKYWELLLIDDGSTDDSLDICESYSNLDNRILFFHKENGGVASARQRGQELAKGVYTIHLDADDNIESRMLSELYNATDDEFYDYVICDYYSSKKGDEKYVSLNVKNKFNPSDLIDAMVQNKISCSCWNKLVRRDLYIDKVSFIEGINMSEDLLWNIRVLSLNPKIIYLPKAFYHYECSNENSLTRNFTKQTIDSDYKLLHTYNEMFAFDPKLLYMANVYIGSDIVFRAFVCNIHGNKEFRRKYGFLKLYVLKSKFNVWLRILLFLSLCGYKSISRAIFHQIKKN